MMRKKLLSLLMCLGILISMLQFPVQAIEKSSNTKYDILCALGFFDESVTYNENAPIQKIVLLNAIISALPEENVFENAEITGYSDVPVTDPNAHVAYNAYLRGLSDKNSKLNMYQALDLESASEILVNLLGYGALANGKSYSAVASELGITKDNTKSTKFTMGNMVNMLYRALDVDIMEIQIIDGQPGYQKSKGKTLLNEVFNIEECTGVVTANPYTGILGHKYTLNNSIRIEDTDYQVNDVKFYDYLGYNVTYYRKNHNNDYYEVLYIAPHKKTQTLEIDAMYLNSYSERTYCYEKNNRKKNVLFSKEACIVYNGKEISQPFDSYMPETGKVLLIDNNGDDIYDVVKITDYEIIVADGYHFEEGIIYNLYSNENIVLEKYTKPESYIITDSHGELAKFTDIDKYDVLFVAKSQDNEFINIVISKEQVSGRVASKSKDHITIDKKTYEISKKNYLQDVTTVTQGIFHLDPAGRVVVFEKFSKSENISGYLVNAKLVDGFEISKDYNVVKIRVFEESGEFKEYFTAEKIFLNDEKTVPENVVNALTTMDASGNYEVIPQLVMYKLNGMQEVSRIYTAYPYNNGSIENHDGFSEITDGVVNLVHRYREFQFHFRVNDDTIIFSVPDDVKKEKNFSVYKKPTDTVPFYYNQYIFCQGFADESNSALASHVIYYPDKSGASALPRHIYAVNKVEYTLNEDDEVIKHISGYRNGVIEEYTLDADTSEKDIVSGDIILLTLDGSNQLVGIEKVFSYESQKQLIDTASDQRNSRRYGFWNVYSTDGYDLMVTKKAPESTILRNDTEFVFLSRITTVIKYNKSKKTFEPAEPRDIIGFSKNKNKYSKVFTATEQTTPYICAIFDYEE